MFTEGTRHFGVWKDGHPSTRRYFAKPTHAILLAYGFCAFLTWFIFILILKVRGEFFLIESLSLPLHRVDSEFVSIVHNDRSSLSLAVRPGEDQRSLRVVFDSGNYFVLPHQEKQLQEYITERVSEIELSAMLQKKLVQGVATADIWVDQRLPMKDVRTLADFLVRMGFDTLRYAVDGRQLPQKRENP